MDIISEICSRESCTGCATCASICHKNCIKMFPDEEGFLRPVIDETVCVNCGLCRKKCPINIHYSDDGVEPLTFAARLKDEKLREKSSSGGVFSALAMQILERNGIVIGAGFDENYQVVHKICTEQSKLDELRRSKYVQSCIGNIYCDAKEHLDTGKEVLFCGTPCQVSGIKAYLGKEYNNLYTVDFICHGVPSPFAWSQYLAFHEKNAKSKIKEVSFRSKLNGWKNFCMQVAFQNGTYFNSKVTDDFYLRSFIMDMNLRPSCYHCHFKQKHRQADITMADFWGVEHYLPNWDNDTGVSLAMIHSNGGYRLFDSCGTMLESVEVTFADAVRGNPSMISSVCKPILRDAFMKDLKRLSYDKLYRKYCGKNISSKIRRKVSYLCKDKK